MSGAVLPPFQRLLDDHGGSLWSFCQAVLGPDDGADLFQDTVLAALRAYPSLSHGANLRAWLFTIAHRRRIDRARALSRRAEHQAGRWDASIASDGSGCDPADELVGEEVWAAVAQLPDKQRLAIAYRFGADLPFAEIAGIIGCSESAARQNVRAGLAKLRSEVTP